MSLRRVLNVMWQVLCEDLAPEGITELRKWINSPCKAVDPRLQQEEERKRKARENAAAAADLSRAFRLGK